MLTPGISRRAIATRSASCGLVARRAVIAEVGDSLSSSCRGKKSPLPRKSLSIYGPIRVTMIIPDGDNGYAARFAAGCCSNAAQENRRKSQRLMGRFAGVSSLHTSSEFQECRRSARADREDADAEDRQARRRIGIQTLLARPIGLVAERRRT